MKYHLTLLESAEKAAFDTGTIETMRTKDVLVPEGVCNVMVTCRMPLNRVIAKIAAGVTTEKLVTLNNHLLACSYCPEEIKRHAREWRGNTDDDDEVDQPVQTSVPATSKRTQSDSMPNNAQPSKQKKFTIVSTKAHTFPPSKQVEWENQLLRAIVFAGWAFNSISDPV
jgi:hypothetical protein